MSQNSLNFSNNSSSVFFSNANHPTHASKVWHQSSLKKFPSSQHLVKSMIKNIPGNGHKNNQLSNNLQVLLLLQSAQITRLTQLLQFYSVRKNELQKLPHNQRSYQIQIKELTDQIQLKQQKYQILLKNLAQFQDANKNLIYQIDRLVRQNELKGNRMTQSIRTVQQESQYKQSMLISQIEQINQINQQYQNKVALISQQVIRVNNSNVKNKQLLQNAQKQLDLFRSKYNQLNKKLIEQIQKNKKNQYEFMNLRTKLNKQLQIKFEQNQNLKKYNQNMKKYYEELQFKFKTLLDQKREIQYNYQSEKSVFSQELNKNQSRLRQLQQQKDRQFLQIQKQNQQLRLHINRMKKQIDSIVLSYNQKQDKIKNLENDIASYQNKLQSLQQNYNMSNKSLKEQLQKERTTIEHLIRQKDEIVRQLNTKSMTVSSVNLRNQNIFKELQGKEKQLEAKTKDSQQKARQIQAKNKEIFSLQKQLEITSIKFSQINKQLQKTQTSSSHETQKLQINLSRLQQDIHQKQNQLLSQKEKIINTENHLNMLSHQLQRLTILLKQKDSTINQQSLTIRDYMKAESQRVNQVRTLRQVVSKKQIQIETSQREKNTYGLMIKQLANLKQIIARKDRHIEELSQQIERIGTKIRQLSEQQLKLVALIQQSINENKSDQILQQIRQLSKTIYEFRKSTKEDFQQVFNENFQINQNILSNEKTLNNYLNNPQQQKQYIKTLNTKIQHLNQEIQTKVTVIATFQSEVTFLRSQLQSHKNYEQILKKIQEKESSSQNLSIKLKSQLSKITLQHEKQINKLHQNYFNQSSQKQIHISKLQQTIQYMQDQMNRLISQSTQIHQTVEKYKQIHKIQITSLQSSLQKLNQHNNRLSKQLSSFKVSYESLSKEKLMLQELQKQSRRHIQSLESQNRSLLQQIQYKKNQFLEIQQKIQQKKEEIFKFNQVISKNNEQYIQKNHLQKQKLKKDLNNLNLRIAQLQSSDKFKAEEQQKLLKIIEIQKEQIKKNKESYEALHIKFTQLQSTSHKKEEIQSKQFQQYQQQIIQLKKQSEHLQQFNANLQTLIQNSIKKIKQLQNHIKSTLQQKQSESIKKIQHLIHKNNQLQNQLKLTTNYQQKISKLQFLLQEKEQIITQLKIDFHYNQQTQSNRSLLLSRYQYKINQITEQCEKLSIIIKNLSHENMKLKSQKSEITLQLKKAQLSNQKIKILSNEIDRLNYKNIDLDSQLTECRLVMSGQTSVQSRYQEQLCLIVLLFAQIQALRSRLKSKEFQLQNTNRQYRRSMNSSRLQPFN